MGIYRIEPIEEADETESDYMKRRASVYKKGKEARARIRREFNEYLKEESLKIENSEK